MKRLSILLLSLILLVAIVGCKKEEKINSGILGRDSILLKKGHPTYYGDLQSAKKYAKDFPKQLVAVEGHIKIDSDKTVLNILGDYEMITAIEIYTNKLEETVNEEVALNVVEKYLPWDILDEYYEKPKFSQYKPDKNSKTTLKIINYSLKELHRQGDHGYNGQVTVYFEENKDEIKYIAIISRELSWMSSAKHNGYAEEEWNPEFKTE